MSNVDRWTMLRRDAQRGSRRLLWPWPLGGSRSAAFLGIARRIPQAAALAALFAFSVPGAGHAQTDGPVERTVVTRDGAMYRGEVKEYVVGDHITLRTDAGEVFLIAWGDAVQISPPRPKQGSPARPPSPAPPPPPSVPSVPSVPSPPPPSVPSPPPPSVPSRPAPIVNNQPVPTPVPPNTERTIVTKDGITYHGEVREFETGSHVLLVLANGERRRIAWADAKRISPPHTRGDHDPTSSPELTVVMPDGSTVRGDLVESQIGDYTLLKLPSGQLRRIAWRDAKRIMLPNPTGRPSTIPVTGELLIVLDNGKRIQGEYFEYIADEQLILRHASGGFRFIPVSTIKKILQLGENSAPSQ
jgi:hypothetical protein